MAEDHAPFDTAARRRAEVLVAARATPGFLPEDEGIALHLVASRAARGGRGPLVEIGAYCGRSTLFLAAALVGLDGPPTLYSVDHHRGSEEMQAGWPHHEPALVDRRNSRMDSLPAWRRAVERAGVESFVVGLVGDSPRIARDLSVAFALVFLDGGHGEAIAWADYRGWSGRVAPGGFLVIHDVFADPRDGGRPPYEVYLDALGSGGFVEERGAGRRSLKVLRRIAPAATGTPREASTTRRGTRPRE